MENIMEQLKLVDLDHVFSCPILKLRVPEYKKLNKKISSEARLWRKTAQGINVSNKGDSWHSPDGLLSRPEPGFSEISAMFPKAAAVYVKKIGSDIDLAGYNAIHTHGRFHLSGVYYVKQPSVGSGESGMIEFVNSRFDHHIFQELNTNAFAPKISLRPKEGDMIVFPSTLLHSVYPNETDEERITIAWNLIFQRKDKATATIPNPSQILKKGKATLKI
jgi:hypothetical protein